MSQPQASGCVERDDLEEACHRDAKRIARFSLRDQSA
jgi:hypothetical protein